MDQFQVIDGKHKGSFSQSPNDPLSSVQSRHASKPEANLKISTEQVIHSDKVEVKRSEVLTTGGENTANNQFFLTGVNVQTQNQDIEPYAIMEKQENDQDS